MEDLYKQLSDAIFFMDEEKAEQTAAEIVRRACIAAAVEEGVVGGMDARR